MTRIVRSVGIAGLALAAAALAGACAAPAATSGGGAEEPAPKHHRGRAAAAAAEPGDGAEETAAEESGPSLPLPKAGVKDAEHRSMSAQVSLTFETADGSTGGMSDKAFSLAEDRRVLVEKVGEKAVTRISILYGKRETKGLEGWTPLPTENNGYAVDSQGGAPKVLQDGKNPATAEEAKVVLAEYGYVGGPHPLLVAIARSKDGGAQSLDAEGQVALLGYNPEITVDRAEVTFDSSEEVGGRSSLLVNVSLHGSLPDGSLKYEFDLTGPAHVDATTGWVTALKLAGKLTPSGKVKMRGRELKATGKGKIELQRESQIL